MPSVFKSLAALALATLAISLAGCRTPGYHKHDVAALNSQAAAAAVQVEARELELAMSTLGELVNQPAADAKPQFLRFSQALDRLADSSRRATKSLNRLWAKRTAYFQVWDSEIVAIKDEEIRKRSQARRAEVAAQFEAAGRQHDEAQQTLAPLIGYLRDIRRALSTDLTRQGLTAVQPLVTTSTENMRKVQTSLTQLAAVLDDLGARTSSVRVQEVKTK